MKRLASTTPVSLPARRSTRTVDDLPRPARHPMAAHCPGVSINPTVKSILLMQKPHHDLLCEGSECLKPDRDRCIQSRPWIGAAIAGPSVPWRIGMSDEA